VRGEEKKMRNSFFVGIGIQFSLCYCQFVKWEITVSSFLGVSATAAAAALFSRRDEEDADGAFSLLFLIFNF
jgi:hypothetical protein